MDLIPVTLLTGFLGSGKSTLLTEILKQPAFDKTAVIVNEFGEIGLDGNGHLFSRLHYSFLWSIWRQCRNHLGGVGNF